MVRNQPWVKNQGFFPRQKVDEEAHVAVPTYLYVFSTISCISDIFLVKVFIFILVHQETLVQDIRPFFYYVYRI